MFTHPASLIIYRLGKKQEHCITDFKMFTCPVPKPTIHSYRTSGMFVSCSLAIFVFSFSIHVPYIFVFSLSIHVPYIFVFSLSIHVPYIFVFSLSIHVPYIFVLVFLYMYPIYLFLVFLYMYPIYLFLYMRSFETKE